MNLIINADDFGRSSEINRAVLLAHRQGVLTSASLMIAGAAADEAIAMARDTPGLAVGLHVVAVDGPAVLPRLQIPDLVDEDGRFPNTPVGLGVGYCFSRRIKQQLAAELGAQFAAFARTGIPLAHVDGHQHMHVHPAIFNLILPLAGQYGARRIRIPRESLFHAIQRDPTRIAIKISWALCFSVLSGWCRHKLRNSPIEQLDRTYGLMDSGNMTEAIVLDILHQLQGPSNEIYFHPTIGRRLEELGPNPEDLQTLLSPEIRRAIANKGLHVSAPLAFSASEAG